MSIASQGADLGQVNGAAALQRSQSRFGDFATLMKPRVMSLVVFTALVGLLLAPGHLEPTAAFASLLCIAGGAGAAGALNMWYDADIDAVMMRTAMRPIPSGRVSRAEALAFGLMLVAASVVGLDLSANTAAAALLAFTLFFYVIVYTMLLKRRTPHRTSSVRVFDSLLVRAFCDAVDGYPLATVKFGRATRLLVFKRKGEAVMNRWLRGYVLIFVLALSSVAVVNPAFARTVYDGGWSVLIVSDRGACESTYRFGVQIADGMVLNDAGGLATVQGRVSRGGAVSVLVRSGSQWARGSGRLNRNRGGGTWRGQGTSGTCDGTWVAERRG